MVITLSGFAGMKFQLVQPGQTSRYCDGNVGESNFISQGGTVFLKFVLNYFVIPFMLAEVITWEHVFLARWDPDSTKE